MKNPLKMPKKGLFEVPKWDDDAPDLSKEFRVKKVPFLIDRKKAQEEKAKRKILKAKRLLDRKNGNKMETNGDQVGKFVRAPPQTDDDIDDTFDVFGLSDRGRKRQLSDDEDSADDTFERRLKQPIQQPRKAVIAKSAFDKAKEVNMEADEDQGWKTVEKPKKKMKKNNEMEVDTPKQVVQIPEKSQNANGKDFKSHLIDSLKGSRFRYMNEQMYKCKGDEAKKMFDEDPQAFVAYHEGYRQQVQQWPSNPLDRIIKSIKKLPVNNIIADFGCGEARLAAEVPQEVYSLDLVAAKPEVIACDMAHTPLKNESVDVAVFCLSLMGTNLKDFLLEANRVLKPRGTLKIAEVASRFDNVKYFVANVEKCGFTLQNTDTNDKLFYFFNFKKQTDAKQVASKVKTFSLKPCLYKKR
ncbi:ribosomal RNA-processing protein 8 [Culicoides brevitarsis]|uniref:ribosomal RNA-processing protein 8 n=1 Tax=Culicoides brevitarsis TaxID=469753 RepID=UPI00307B4B79